uniref:Uncharacterized protein n=1 Tax=Arundo donax TaxID=35708 RepID=A0A0A9H6B4_ARUDO
MNLAMKHTVRLKHRASVTGLFTQRYSLLTGSDALVEERGERSGRRQSAVASLALVPRR